MGISLEKGRNEEWKVPEMPQHKMPMLWFQRNNGDNSQDWINLLLDTLDMNSKPNQSSIDEGIGEELHTWDRSECINVIWHAPLPTIANINIAIETARVESLGGWLVIRYGGSNDRALFHDIKHANPR
jgi:hypothetical protein